MLTKDERLEEIDRSVAQLDRRLDKVFATLRDMAEGWKILASQIGDIHEACCGEQPPSELAGALRDLAAAIDRQGKRIEELVARSPRPMSQEEWDKQWQSRTTSAPLAKLRPDGG